MLMIRRFVYAFVMLALAAAVAATIGLAAGVQKGQVVGCNHVPLVNGQPAYKCP